MAGRIRSIEKSNDLIGIQIRDLPVCSIVTQLRYRLPVFSQYHINYRLTVDDSNPEVS
jgi:hypothetical protein